MHILKGKVRVKCSLDMTSELESYTNDWIAIEIDDEWRLVDVHFASKQRDGSDPGDWELIDDDGKVGVFSGYYLYDRFNSNYTMPLCATASRVAVASQASCIVCGMLKLFDLTERQLD